ncbi:MAG TPA: RAD55 family ATPase [Candidatus Angelobacter sp.]|nr:RAD55 family ATPase [Candidatus Angelobacter sp.]
MSVSGPVGFSLWVNSTAAVSLIGLFGYLLPGGVAWNNIPSSPYSISKGFHIANFTLDVGQPPITYGTQLAVAVNASSVPTNANVTLYWGSVQTPSHVRMILSQYETMPQPNPVAVQDHSGNPSSYFNLNPGSGNNIVLIQASVISALGPVDIAKVNLTIVDQSLNNRAVGSANVNMTPYLPYSQLSPPPYVYLVAWSYPLNSTQGTYQVWIDIVDVQGNIAFSYRGPASFGLVPPGFVPFPYNLIPYFLVGGIGAAGGVGGAVFYRKRRGKSYLIPFNHFNSLTGGELSGGTVVTVEGNTGSGKSLLLEQLMAEDLRSGRPCVFVTTADFPSNIRANLKTLGLDISGYEQNGLLTFVDGYSAEAGQESREKIFIPSLGDLTTLGIKITSALPSESFKGGSLYFDSLTPLASKAKPESIVSFVQSVGARVKGLSGKAYFTVGLGVDATVQRQLEDTADCIVQMEAFEESGSRKRRLRIAKFRARKHQEGWALFTIEDGKGIIFYSKKPRK